MLGVCKNAASAIIKTAKPAVSLAKLNGASHKLIPAAYNREYPSVGLSKAYQFKWMGREWTTKVPLDIV